jgi:uncharacterized protein (DUF58 family)
VAGFSFGAMRSRSRGSGLDLAGARPYRPGDDVRRIDWRASARLSSALASDEFIVREHLADEATRVVVVVDRSPSMELYPPELPWLSKPAAVLEASSMILESALQSGCAVGYLVDGDAGPEPGALLSEPPLSHASGSRTDTWRVRTRYQLDGGSRDRTQSLARSLAYLSERARALPPGAFVFLLSDFLALPGDGVWDEALERGFDLVPVVIQDPVWEQSFPDVAGALVPLADPATGRLAPVLLTRAEVRARRHENEARLEGILDRLEGFGLDYVLVSSHDRGRVLAAFLDWAAGRHQGARLAR